MKGTTKYLADSAFAVILVCSVLNSGAFANDPIINTSNEVLNRETVFEDKGLHLQLPHLLEIMVLVNEFAKQKGWVIKNYNDVFAYKTNQGFRLEFTTGDLGSPLMPESPSFAVELSRDPLSITKIIEFKDRDDMPGTIDETTLNEILKRK
jgi:hypothetical protein